MPNAAPATRKPKLPPQEEMARFVTARLRELSAWQPGWPAEHLDALEAGDLHTFYSALVEGEEPRAGLLQRLKTDGSGKLFKAGRG